MARRAAEPPPTPPSIPPAKAIPLVERQLKKLKEICEDHPINDRAHDAWENSTRELLIKCFGSASQNVDSVINSDSGPISFGMSEEDLEASTRTKIGSQIALMESCVEQLKLLAKLEGPDKKTFDADRAAVLEEVYAAFLNDAHLPDADQFEIDHQDKIDAFDSLLRDGTLSQSGGRLDFSLGSYVKSKFWLKDEVRLNQLLPLMREIYSERKEAQIEVKEFVALIVKKGILLGVRPMVIERLLRLFERLGLLSGHNPQNDEHGVPRIKSFGVSKMILRIKTIADQVKNYCGSAETISLAMKTSAEILGATQGGLAAVIPAPVKSNSKVFIVHGHDGKVRDEVAKLIKLLGLEPVILHEKANQGMTLVEKFIKHSDVGFAVVVMTADDLGKAKTKKKAQPRARQNVVFEWGYFIGSLGRDHVCALYEKGIDPPSDLHGIVYIPLDVGGRWRFEVLRELKVAGYAVDANKLRP